MKQLARTLLTFTITVLLLVCTAMALSGCEPQKSTFSAAEKSALDQVYSEFTYVEDMGSTRKWKTINQVLAEGDDCEGFVLLTRWRLQSAGVSPDDIEILIGKHSNLGYHMVIRLRGMFIDHGGIRPFYPDFKITNVYTPKMWNLQLAYSGIADEAAYAN